MFVPWISKELIGLTESWVSEDRGPKHLHSQAIEGRIVGLQGSCLAEGMSRYLNQNAQHEPTHTAAKQN
jgi:hypothetical protein